MLNNSENLDSLKSENQRLLEFVQWVVDRWGEHTQIGAQAARVLRGEPVEK